MISVFDIYKVGIGPSSSHTVGPMRAAREFLEHVKTNIGLDKVTAVEVELFGSLGQTGVGHGTGKAVILGLAGWGKPRNRRHQQSRRISCRRRQT